MKSAGPKLTLREFAKRIGLSPTTVSRALSGYSDVNESTRARVRQAAKAMGYAPNRSAQRLAHGVVGAIGVLIPDDESLLIGPLLAEFLGGVAEQAAKTELDVVLHIQRKALNTSQFERFIAKRSVDGFIVSTPLLNDERVALLQRANVPFVVHGRLGESDSYLWLDIDNFQAAFDATTHFVTAGHQRIAIINGSHDSRFARDRYEGMVAALYEQGLSVKSAWVREGAMTESEGYAAARHWLEMPPRQRPTAIYCATVLVAAGVYRALKERGLQAPDALSVIAHDDDCSCLNPAHLDPPLSTTYSSLRKAGQSSTGLLQALLASSERHALVSALWPVDLRFASSVGPPPPECVS